MRVRFVTTLLASSVLAIGLTAQAGQEKPKPDPAQAPQAPKEHTMTGCVQKGTESGTFVVMNTAEKAPKTIVILSSKDKLDGHVGHKIDITGTAVPAKEAETMKKGKGDHYMNITAIKMVSTTCP